MRQARDIWYRGTNLFYGTGTATWNRNSLSKIFRTYGIGILCLITAYELSQNRKGKNSTRRVQMFSPLPRFKSFFLSFGSLIDRSFIRWKSYWLDPLLWTWLQWRTLVKSIHSTYRYRYSTSVHCIPVSRVIFRYFKQYNIVIPTMLCTGTLSQRTFSWTKTLTWSWQTLDLPKCWRTTSASMRCVELPATSRLNYSGEN